MPRPLNVLSVRRPWWTLFGVFALVSHPALAVPTQLTQGGFQALIAGDPTVLTETFTSYSGAQSNPFLILNATYWGNQTPSVSIGSSFCSDSVDHCLTQMHSVSISRTFNTLPAGTKTWGTDFHALNSSNVFDITVVGGSGTLVLNSVAASDFYGFQDALGLTSLTFRNVTPIPTSNYSFDNVTTANVPEPSTALLLAFGLVGFAVGGRRRKR